MQLTQHYEGTLYRVAEILEALAVIHRQVTPEELRGEVAMRYTRTWKHRTLIAGCRAVNSTSDYGLGYGPDWKGELHTDPTDGSRTAKVTKTSYPLKRVLTDFLKTGKLPFKVLKAPVSLIRRRDEEAWIAYSLRSHHPLPEDEMLVSEAAE